MSENVKASSGAETETSGSVLNEGDETPSGSESQGYKPEFVQKLKKEKDNWRTKYEELAAAKQAEKEEKLKAEAQYKELWEAERDAKAKLAEELKSTKETIKQAKVRSAVKGELSKLGVVQEHWQTVAKLIDWSKVQVDPETETVINADSVAKSFYDTHNTLGFFAKQGAKANHSAPAMNSGMTSGDVFKSELRKAKTQKELDAVLKKFNMTS